jgi:hypothetical protein
MTKEEMNALSTYKSYDYYRKIKKSSDKGINSKISKQFN